MYLAVQIRQICSRRILYGYELISFVVFEWREVQR